MTHTVVLPKIDRPSMAKGRGYDSFEKCVFLLPLVMFAKVTNENCKFQPTTLETI